MQNIPTTNMQTTAYDLILQKILLADYIPGQKISENMITADIQLGRTPVREALIHLKKDKLIEVIPQSGTYVSRIDLVSAKNARFVRENIEKEVVKEATQHHSEAVVTRLTEIIQLQQHYLQENDAVHFFAMDDEFHRAFYEAINKTQVWDWLQILNTQLTRFRWLRLKISDLKWQTLIDQHSAILKAIETQDSRLATKLVVDHLHLMLEEQQRLITVFPDYFINVD
ncbi:GntR family transcriptional regulator [Latilactobacillus fuchuensis]|uniref:Gntr family transcription regulator n=1 Tax=Latilactobacillus fuchuensis DSM 14340 = JCM 11249 TaxID=1423747 RepID=A0A0R1S1H1_9LACO|nr:GntR family transcriptional regulator [Latilactobacillus fuchuensis]KRL61428.1 gntr family transcription regulator [Latilactobacillus fuchuensis DSM 14340 = JCM 11249]